ncbi:MAG: hypothetical protein ACQKBW_05665 [Puniceicoccales bacterium]
MKKLRRQCATQWRKIVARRELRKLGNALAAESLNDRTYFSILMPGCLHIARCAVERFPASFSLVLIGNGLSHAEEQWCRQHLSGHKLFSTKVVVAHGSIIKVLLQNTRVDFGIIDYDCFIQEPSLLQDLSKFKDGVVLNTAYSYRSADAQIELPDTYLLLFKQGLLVDVMRKYGVGPGTYRWSEIPAKAQVKLRECGYSEAKLPEAHKDFFDTLRVACILAECEGYSLGYVERYWGLQGFEAELRAFHIGNVSSPSPSSNPYVQRGTLFWALCLFVDQDAELIGFAEGYFGAERIREIKANITVMRDAVSDDFLTFCEGFFGKAALQKVFLD